MASKDLKDTRKMLDDFTFTQYRRTPIRGMSNDCRRKIYETITNSKGVSLDTLSSELGYSENLLKYHLTFLEKHHMVTRDQKVGKYYKS